MGQIKKKSQKPKKMAISSLFLQDVKYEMEQKKRKSAIDQKTKENLAKRRKKKNSQKNIRTKKKNNIKMDIDEDDDIMPDQPKLGSNQSMASHIMKSNRKKNKNNSKKKHNIKAKVNLSSLKKIDFTQKLIHKTVNAEKKVRIGF